MDNLRFSDIKSNVSINEWDKRRRYVVAVTLSSYTTSASGCFSFLNHRLYTTTDFHFRFLVFIYGCHTILVGGFRVVYTRPQVYTYFANNTFLL
uniref:Uncharacterized protein n=1 Tax=Glossina palpalis gambiensis TaxID=67801 RepID=A0A1B0ART9_9MUSC